jgi:hypothetical protein
MKDTRTISKAGFATTQRAQRRAAAQVAEYIHELSPHAKRRRQPSLRVADERAGPGVASPGRTPQAPGAAADAATCLD